MLREDDSRTFHDEMADAAVEVVRERGVSGLSVRAIARTMRLTPQALLNRYDDRTRVIVIVIGILTARWRVHHRVRWQDAVRYEPEASLAGILALLPAPGTDDVRVWLACYDWARTQEGLSGVVAEARAEEFAHLDDSLQLLVSEPVAQEEVDAVAAVLDAVRHRMVDRVEPMSLEAARAALRTAVRGVQVVGHAA